MRSIPKFKVVTDHSWNFRAWAEWFVEADTSAKAKYKVAKAMGYGGREFRHFISLFLNDVEKLPDNNEVGYRDYYSELPPDAPEYNIAGMLSDRLCNKKIMYERERVYLDALKG